MIALICKRPVVLVLIVAAMADRTVQGTLTTEQQQKLAESEFVPQLFKTPAGAATVSYGHLAVDFGNELTPTVVKPEPQITWEAENSTLYTIFFTDPDVKPLESYMHWMVVNVPGNDISRGKTVYSYRGAAPRKENGIHRYVFQIYQQTQPIGPEVTDRLQDKTLLERAQLSVPKFVEENQLKGPVAANFFRAQFDDLVPQIHAEIMQHYGVTSVPRPEDLKQ